ncbi:hypothetical protein [Tunturiibacter empetritectus]|uniref:hypothetical protein n=1 Tax=Tunturiibacter empetritectus TaxID=3069691 RepID=UPI003D9B0367
MGTTANRRKIWIVALGACLLILFVALATLNAFNTQLPKPASTQQTVIFTGLSIVAFLLFVTVLLMLVRNVLKLYADQRSRVMGTRLRTRMLWGAVLVSLVPIASMFAFSYQLMNRAVDRWFTQPVTDMREDSNNMALELAHYTTANARAEADSIAASLPAAPVVAPVAKAAGGGSEAASGRGSGRRSNHGSLPGSAQAVAPAASRNREAIHEVLRQHEITLQNGFAIVYREGRVVASFHMPQGTGATAKVKVWLPDQVAADMDKSSAQAPADPVDAAILAAAQRMDQPVFLLAPRTTRSAQRL